MNAGPLTGVRVVDFGQLIAGAGAAGRLAALGADVIKVEPRGGESARHMGSYGSAILRSCNQGKRSIALDLRAPDGAAAARRLVASADVVVQNMRPGAMERLGFGPDTVRAAHPRIVYASVTGFPADGPSRDRAGLDIAAQAESGMMSITGEAGGEPQRVGFTVVDVATADLLGQAILAALFARERTGRGDDIRISLLETALHLQATIWAEYGETGVEPVRSGNGQPTVAPAAEVLRVADGEVVLSAYTDVHWRRLCTVIGRPELAQDARFADNPSRITHRTELRALLEQALGSATRDEVVALLAGNGLVGGAIRRYREIAATPDVRAAGIFPDARSEEVPVPRLPFRLASWDQADAAAPVAGQHGAEVLAECGYDADEIGRLIATGVVAAPEPEVVP